MLRGDVQSRRRVWPGTRRQEIDATRKNSDKGKGSERATNSRRRQLKQCSPALTLQLSLLSPPRCLHRLIPPSLLSSDYHHPPPASRPPSTHTTSLTTFARALHDLCPSSIHPQILRTLPASAPASPPPTDRPLQFSIAPAITPERHLGYRPDIIDIPSFRSHITSAVRSAFSA